MGLSDKFANKILNFTMQDLQTPLKKLDSLDKAFLQKKTDDLVERPQVEDVTTREEESRDKLNSIRAERARFRTKPSLYEFLSWRGSYSAPKVISKSTKDYQKYLKSLILEESRAIIQQNLQRARESKPSYMHQTSNRFNDFILEGFLPLHQIEGARTHIIVLLQPAERRGLRRLGYAWVKDIDEESGCVRINVDLRENDYDVDDFESETEIRQDWKVTLLCSLVTQARMYEACDSPMSLPFFDNLIAGKVAPLPEAESQQAIHNKLTEEYQARNLNPSQENAITNFLSLKEGIQILQGPPGTGKTTTIVAMATLLSTVEKKRVLICAPSNKAVHVIAERLIKQKTPVPIALAGVNKKITPTLRNIFVHTWGETKAKACLSIINTIKNCKLDPSNYQALIRTQEHQDDLLTTELIAAKKSIQELLDNTKNFLTHESYITAAIQRIDKKLNSCEQDIKLLKSDETFRKDDINKSEFPALGGQSSKKSTQNRNLRSRSERMINSPEAHISKYNRHIDSLLQSLNDLSTDFIDCDEVGLLNSARIVLCTLSTSGRNLILKMDEVDCLIVDEAGQAVESETLIPLQHRPKTVALVGDVNQLPATVISSSAKEYHYDWSMLWRLQVVHNQPHTVLSVQYRMEPCLRQWPSKQFYNDLLTDGGNIETRPKPSFFCDAHMSGYKLVNIDGHETKSTLKSYENKREVNAIYSSLEYMIQKGQVNKNTTVGIISFYMGQVTALNKALSAFKDRVNLHISTVDGFQGEECDIIIISTVRANSSGNIGFTDDFRRLNVAITRAKFSLIIFCNTKTFQKTNTNMAALIRDAKTRGGIFYQESEFVPLKTCHTASSYSTMSSIVEKATAPSIKKKPTKFGVESLSLSASYSTATKATLTKTKTEKQAAKPFCEEFPPLSSARKKR